MDRYLDIKETAVLLVDLQKDYCAPGFICANPPISWDVTAADQLCYDHIEFLHNLRDKMDPSHIIWTKMEERKSLYAENVPYGKSESFIEMCLIGTEGHETHVVKPHDGEVVMIKRHCSAFSVSGQVMEPINSKGQNLDAYLKSKGIKNLAITGVIESRCVGSTINGASERGYYCYALTDLIGHGKETNIKNLEVSLENEAQATRKISDTFLAYNTKSKDFLDRLK